MPTKEVLGMSVRAASPKRGHYCPTRDQIYDFLKSKPSSPTVQEIADEVGRSKSTVEHHLIILSNQGLIQMDNKARWRSIKVIDW